MIFQMNYSNSQSGSGFLNWTYPGFDSYNSNFDPQTVINSNNVGQLQLTWVYQVPSNPFNIAGTAQTLGIETTPLVYDGILYFATPYNRIIALNAQTGSVIWYYQVNMTQFVNEPWWAPAFNERSLTYYDGTIYFMASDTSVYGLNALNGQLVFSLPAVAQNITGNTGQYYGELAPIIYKNMMIVRASTTDYGGRGFVAAYDLSTKQLLWTWYSIPPSGGNATWDQLSTSGNVSPYSGDWGNNTLIGGGAAWGLMSIDNSTGIAYFSTGHPSDVYNASLRPGPNLYSDSIIALNLTSGKMIWYYQINSHDLTEHEGGWSVTLANVDINGTPTEVVIQAAKNNYIYVVNAATGKLAENPIEIGSPNFNDPNDNAVSGANLTESQSSITGVRICPGPDGGVEMAPGYDNNTLFVASQNACGIMNQNPVTYKGQTINGYLLTGDATAPENSTIYAINLSTGSVEWTFASPNRYQGSAIVVSGGVVYAVDRAGILYALSEKSGTLLRSLSLGGVGAAGVSIAEALNGQVELFVPAGGADISTPTPGVVAAFTVPTTTVTGTSSSVSSNTGTQSILEVTTAAFAVIIVALSLVILFRRPGSKKTPT
jgi:alcohol dehydrogenase (cytochrome c)